MRYVFLCLFSLMCCGVQGQIITTYAGGGSIIGDGGMATAAKTALPGSGAFDGMGNYYFASAESRIRMVSPSGIITTVAGTGTTGYSGDSGPATAAKIHNAGFDVDSIGNIYIADSYNGRLRKVNAATGIITTIAGNGATTSTGDGGAASSATVYPVDILVTRDGSNIYLAGDNRIRRISPSGIISGVAGNGTVGHTGDGGPATAAVVSTGYGICFDLAGNLVFVTGSGCRVRKVTLSTGIITSIAGTGVAMYNGDGIHADSANFKAFDLAYDAFGCLYLADYVNQRIRMIDTSGTIHTVAGSGTSGFSGDGGPATAAKIYGPEGLVIDKCGNLYIGDCFNNRIRKVTYPSTPVLSITSTAIAAIGSSVVMSATTVGGCCPSNTYIWFNKGVPFDTTSTPSATYTKAMCTDSITAVIYGCGDSAISNVQVVRCGVSIGSLQPVVGSCTVYPNPVHGELFIEVNGEKINSVVVMNLVGTVVAKQSYNGVAEAHISTADLPAGIYFVKVNGVYMERVVKR